MNRADSSTSPVRQSEFCEHFFPCSCTEQINVVVVLFVHPKMFTFHRVIMMEKFHCQISFWNKTRYLLCYTIYKLLVYTIGNLYIKTTDEQQGDLDDGREITALWCWNVKKTKFRGGHLGFLSAILDWQWVLDKPVLYIWW